MSHAAGGDSSANLKRVDENNKFNLRVEGLDVATITKFVWAPTFGAAIAIGFGLLFSPLAFFEVLLKIHSPKL